VGGLGGGLLVRVCWIGWSFVCQKIRCFEKMLVVWGGNVIMIMRVFKV